MKKSIIVALLSIFSFQSYSQLAFEAGYSIDNKGTRTDCLIRNNDKTINPTEFEYRVSGDSDIKIASIKFVKQFEILNTVHKYERHTVNIDRSTFNIKELSTSALPEFNKEELFLRVSVEGKASLYSYFDRNGIKKFFFRLDEGDVQELVYKQYSSGGSKILENSSYKQKLWLNLKCESLGMDNFSKIDYNEKALAGIFVKYNECVGSAFNHYSGIRKKGAMALELKAGINSASLKIRQKIPAQHVNIFEQQTSPQFSIEGEYIFPSRKYKWSAFFEPTAQTYKASGRLMFYTGNPVPSNPNGIGGEKANLDVNYSLLILPVGVRHYFFINRASKIFLSAAFAYSIILNPAKVFDVGDFYEKPDFKQEDTHLFPAFIAGLGFQYKGRMSVEIGYHANKTMVHNRIWRANFDGSLSFVFGYTLTRGRHYASGVD
ncbi:MAG TPA: hypothetical protein VK625_08560 [Flavitalea sp.]|nr:hypothetical protein [Flavitalea sp.]